MDTEATTRAHVFYRGKHAQRYVIMQQGRAELARAKGGPAAVPGHTMLAEDQICKRLRTPAGSQLTEMPNSRGSKDYDNTLKKIPNTQQLDDVLQRRGHKC